MDAIINQQIIDLYFKAWKTYDISLLHKIFSPNAKYVIENKNKIYVGIGEISQYWLRNKNRQHGLKLCWKNEEDACAIFRAQFWDNEEKEHQEIIGKIYFDICSSKKIVELRECDKKIIYP